MNIVALGTILETTKGKKPIRQSKEPLQDYLPYVDIKAFETGIINSYTDGEKSLPCEEGDILMVWDGSRSGLVGYAIKGYVGSTLAKVTAKGLIRKYLFYFLQGQYALLNTKKKGTGTPHVNPEVLNNAKLVVPSIPEQKRIVARIEELFSQLDNGMKTLQTIKQQLSVHRQAVLKEAFEGTFTSDWRASHSDCSPLLDFESIKIANPIFQDTSGDESELDLQLPETWLKIRIGEVFKVDIGSTPSRAISNYWNGTINWVSSGEVRFNSIYRSKEFITQDGLNNSSTKIQPIGTILLAMIGEGKTRGQAAILKVEAAHNQNTAAILVSETPCIPKYIYYFLYLNYENTRRVGSGNNQKALNRERVRALRFPFPSFAEQGQIVKEIESRLSVCDSIEQTVDNALQQAEGLRQSILKEAFEGRLI